MDSNIYFVRRIGSAKALGLVIGLIGFFLVPVFWPDQSMWLRVGILLWYGTFGALAGIRSPFWIVLEGAVLGLVIDAVVTRFAGEGIPGPERVSP